MGISAPRLVLRKSLGMMPLEGEGKTSRHGDEADCEKLTDVCAREGHLADEVCHRSGDRGEMRGKSLRGSYRWGTSNIATNYAHDSASVILMLTPAVST